MKEMYVTPEVELFRLAAAERLAGEVNPGDGGTGGSPQDPFKPDPNSDNVMLPIIK